MIDLGRDIEPNERQVERAPEASNSRERPGAAREDHTAPRERGPLERDVPAAERSRSGHSVEADPRAGPSRATRERSATRSGRQLYRTSEDERRLLYDVGRFRTIAEPDLQELRYGGDAARMRQDVRSLTAQGLLERKRVWTGRHRASETYLALTKGGKRIAQRNPDRPQDQALYAGFCKPAELRHDAAIYRMYEREAERIVREGGRVKRVILDYELKRKAYAPLARARALPEREYVRKQAKIARENGLKVVNGHIALPDLRIEYETRSGASAQVDLEVASESYHGSHAAEKAAAGFTIYAAPDTAERLQAALEEREVTADILYL